VTREWLAYLARATESIGSSLDLDQVALGLTEAVVPGLADHAVVYLSEYLLREPDLLPEEGHLESARLVAATGKAEDPDVTVPPAGWLSLAAQDSPEPFVFPVTDSGVAVLFPLRVRGVILGFAVWTRQAAEFQETELLIGTQLAAQAALSLHHVYLYRREAATVDVLQRGMLAVEPPNLPGIEIAHRYLPGSPAARVGGDWFDTIRLRGGRVALTIGDVTGHGIRSAAAMGRLRTAMRTLVALDLPPAEVLYNLDAIAVLGAIGGIQGVRRGTRRLPASPQPSTADSSSARHPLGAVTDIPPAPVTQGADCLLSRWICSREPVNAPARARGATAGSRACAGKKSRCSRGSASRLWLK
jgi:hypothetical protein